MRHTGFGGRTLQFMVIAIACVITCGVCRRTALAAPPSTVPSLVVSSVSASTQPSALDARLNFLTLRLASVEASIAAVNAALKAAGYKAAAAADVAASAQKGNEIMDRKGGGPVPWDQFYGRSARDFVLRDRKGRPYEVERPPQLDYLYKANADQAARAHDDLAAAGRQVDALLTRRRQLEDEQSGLWASIAFESIQNREIAFRPLYRFKLKPMATAAPSPSGVATTQPGLARADILRAAILYLRTADKTVADELASLGDNQEASLKDLQARIDAAIATLQESLATANATAPPGDVDAASAKELLGIAKLMQAHAKNVAEAYHLAQDRDAAHDDAAKLTLRAQLQDALLEFSAATADLDEKIQSIADAWSAAPDPAAANPDKLPPSTPRPAAKRAAAPAPDNAASVAVVKSSATGAAAAANASPVSSNDGWTDLYNGKDTTGWTQSRDTKWTVDNGVLIGKDGKGKLISARRDYADFRLRLETMIADAGVYGLGLREGSGGHYYVSLEKDSGGNIGFWSNSDSKASRTLVAVPATSAPAPGHWITMEILVTGSHFTLWIDGVKTSECDDPDHKLAKGAITILNNGSGAVIKVRRVQIKELAAKS